MKRNYARQIYVMDDDELERFVEDWISSKKRTYFHAERFSGTGDLGRDVVGYKDKRLHDGAWDNFQCKQLSVPLTAPSAMRELAKILYHSANGSYCLPSRYTFVAPMGVTRPARALISHPTKFQAEMKAKWDVTCAEHLVKGQKIALDNAIERTIASFDFSHVEALDAAKLLKDPDIRPVLVAWFGEDPGEAPRGTVPSEIQPEEAQFVSDLLAAYSDHGGISFADAAAVLADKVYGEDLRLQRVRYFDAAIFKRYYRDNVPSECLPTFEDDVFHGVIDTHRRSHTTALARVRAVMEQAAQVHPSGILAKYARVPVKQGICHHFVNEGRLSWKP